MQHVHNGYVRQGWILLINPTGYIVFLSARDGDIPPRPTPFRFPKTLLLLAGPLSRSFSAARSVPRPSILRFYERAVSFYRDELCRRESTAPAGARRYYITLIMRACAKGGTGLRLGPRIPFPPSG